MAQDKNILLPLGEREAAKGFELGCDPPPG